MRFYDHTGAALRMGDSHDSRIEDQIYATRDREQAQEAAEKEAQAATPEASEIASESLEQAKPTGARGKRTNAARANRQDTSDGVSG